MVGQVNTILWVRDRAWNLPPPQRKFPALIKMPMVLWVCMISQSLDYSIRNIDSCKLLKLTRVYMYQAMTGPGKSSPTLPSEIQVLPPFQNDCWICISSIAWNAVPLQEERSREERLFLKRFNFLIQDQICFLETSTFHWPELCHLATLKCKGGWEMEHF